MPRVAAALALAAVAALAATAVVARGGGAVRLERPGALAVGADGTVYVADDGRNQILERRPDGTLRVLVAGGLLEPGGMALAPDGTLVVADQGHDRVVAVSPDGRVRTVAGNGRGGWVRTGTPALAAPILGPGAVTFDPRGRLVIADSGWSEVLRLERDGTLTRLAGNRRYAGVYGVGGPATRGSADGAIALAYDRDGTLFLAGFDTKTLLAITPRGRLEEVGADYPCAGGMTATPDGRVLVANRDEVLEATRHGTRLLLDLRRRRLAGIAGFDVDGIAADAAGDLYLDTWPGGYTNGRTTALVELSRDGRARVLWRSP